MVTWTSPSAQDNSGDVTVTCDLTSGSTFTIGQTDGICEAIDNSGNKANCSFQVIVTGRFSVMLLKW